jgi:ABC-2 type transport system permease protein
MSNRNRRNRLFFASFKAIFKKEFLHLFREPTVVTFALVIPMVELLLLGYILDVNVRQVRTVVYDLANTQESRRLIDQFESTNDFQVVKIVNSDKQMHDAIIAGEARVAIKIPIDYSRQFLEGRTNSIQVIVDGSNATVSGEVVNVSNRITLQESIKRILAKSPNRNNIPIETRTSVLFNPDTRSSNFFLPGLIVWEIPGVTILLVALSIAAEREKGTFEQLSITPINPAGMIIGKLCPYAMLGFFMLCELVLLVRVVFDVPVNGSILLLMLFTIPFIITDIGIGLIVSSGANIQLEAMQSGLIFRVFLPLYFTGYIFPVESTPKYFQWVCNFIPHYHYMEITRGIMLRGAGFEHLWGHGLALVISSFITISLATKIYKKKLS